MRIVLDPEACTGHGRCYALAPEVYDADDEGHCALLITATVPGELEAGARSGAANCPEHALTVEE
jgi:ferredoxin